MGNASTQYVQSETPPPAGVTGNIWTQTYFDGLGRPYKSIRRGPSTKNVNVVTSYNKRGQVATTTLPYFDLDPTYSVSYEYDSLNRMTKMNHADQVNFVRRTYGLFSVTTTDEGNHAQTDTMDVHGRIATHTETHNSTPYTTTYTYSFDNVGRYREWI